MYKLTEELLSEQYDLTCFHSKAIKFVNECYQYNATFHKEVRKRGIECITETAKKYEFSKELVA